MAKSNLLSLNSAVLLPEFKEQLPGIDWPEYAKNFPKISFTSDSFSFYASVSSVYSSKIEGEDIDLNSANEVCALICENLCHLWLNKCLAEGEGYKS